MNRNFKLMCDHYTSEIYHGNGPLAFASFIVVIILAIISIFAFGHVAYYLYQVHVYIGIPSVMSVFMLLGELMILVVYGIYRYIYNQVKDKLVSE